MDDESRLQTRQLTGLILGPLVFASLLLIPAPAGLSVAGMRVAALAVLMAVWWVTQAVPLAVTALLPIVLLPVLGVMRTSEVTVAYGNHLIYLFMGGFLIAVTIERWNLHRRIALQTIRLVGDTPDRIVLGFMVATAFLSMWLSNTATAMMMVTIGMAVTTQARQLLQAEGIQCSDGEFRFGIVLMLGIAYAASIGGIATLIGTPPNALLAGIVEETYGLRIGFAEWMMFGVPLSIAMLASTWFYLTRIAYPDDLRRLPGGRHAIRDELTRLGPMSGQERRVLTVAIVVVIAWVTHGLVGKATFGRLDDSAIAMGGALLLFLCPAGRLTAAPRLLDWQTARGIPWDIIILFGGGFALANAVGASGLTEWLAGRLGLLHGLPLIAVIGAVTVLVIFLTEFTSNTATASLFLPVMGALAQALQIHPLGPMAAAALAASFAFMLPVATPPNAIVFGSRQLTATQMAKAGLWMNVLGIVLITVLVMYLLPVAAHIDLAAPLHTSP